MVKLIYNHFDMLIVDLSGDSFAFRFGDLVVDFNVVEANELASAILRATNESPELIECIQQRRAEIKAKERRQQFDELHDHGFRGQWTTDQVNELISQHCKNAITVYSAAAKLKRRRGY